MATTKTTKKAPTYPKIEVTTKSGKAMVFPKYVALAHGQIMWKDDQSGIDLNIVDPSMHYAELTGDMNLSRVFLGLRGKRIVPFNPKTDKLAYTPENAIDKDADISVLRNDEAWNMLQGPERQVLQDIRKTKDRIVLEKAFKYETNNMNRLRKARVNVVDELLKILKEKRSKVHPGFVQKIDSEPIEVKM